MAELVQANWILLVIALVIGMAVAWWVFAASRTTRVEREAKTEADVLARRNQALIDAPPAAAAAPSVAAQEPAPAPEAAPAPQPEPEYEPEPDYELEEPDDGPDLSWMMPQEPRRFQFAATPADTDHSHLRAKLVRAAPDAEADPAPSLWDRFRDWLARLLA